MDKPNESSRERPLTYPGGKIGIHEFGSYAAKVNGKVDSLRTKSRLAANGRLVQDAKHRMRNKAKTGKKNPNAETHRHMLKRLLSNEGGKQTKITDFV